MCPMCTLPKRRTYTCAGALSLPYFTNVQCCCSDVLGMMMGLCSGLEYVHRRQILHCDIALRNSLRHANGTVKLSDFGLARMADTETCNIKNTSFPIAIRYFLVHSRTEMCALVRINRFQFRSEKSPRSCGISAAVLLITFTWL
jgi:serine/threonine protein kinase